MLWQGRFSSLKAFKALMHLLKWDHLLLILVIKVTFHTRIVENSCFFLFDKFELYLTNDDLPALLNVIQQRLAYFLDFAILLHIDILYVSTGLFLVACEILT